MHRSDLETLLKYHYQAHRQVWDCVMKLSEEQFCQELDYSIGSIYNHCVHLVSVEHFWLDIARDTVPPEGPKAYDPFQYHTRAEIRAAWDALEQETFVYLSSLSDDDLNADIEYEFSFVSHQCHPRWQALMYLITHAIDHRAQILAGIHRMGGETVMQDFIRYVWGKL